MNGFVAESEALQYVKFLLDIVKLPFVKPLLFYVARLSKGAFSSGLVLELRLKMKSDRPYFASFSAASWPSCSFSCCVLKGPLWLRRIDSGGHFDTPAPLAVERYGRGWYELLVLQAW